MSAQDDTAETRTEIADREAVWLCTICGQPSGRAATCWACFVAGDDAYRRAAEAREDAYYDGTPSHTRHDAQATTARGAA